MPFKKLNSATIEFNSAKLFFNSTALKLNFAELLFDNNLLSFFELNYFASNYLRLSIGHTFWDSIVSHDLGITDRYKKSNSNNDFK